MHILKYVFGTGCPKKVTSNRSREVAVEIYLVYLPASK